MKTGVAEQSQSSEGLSLFDHKHWAVRVNSWTSHWHQQSTIFSKLKLLSLDTNDFENHIVSVDVWSPQSFCWQLYFKYLPGVCWHWYTVASKMARLIHLFLLYTKAFGLKSKDEYAMKGYQLLIWCCWHLITLNSISSTFSIRSPKLCTPPNSFCCYHPWVLSSTKISEPVSKAAMQAQGLDPTFTVLHTWACMVWIMSRSFSPPQHFGLFITLVKINLGLISP